MVLSLLKEIGNNVKKIVKLFNSVITTDRQWHLPLYFQFTIRVHGNFIHNRALPISKIYRLGHPNMGDVTNFKFLQNYLLVKLTLSLPRCLVLDQWGFKMCESTRSYKCNQLEVCYPPSWAWYRVLYPFCRRNEICRTQLLS